MFRSIYVHSKSLKSANEKFKNFRMKKSRLMRNRKSQKYKKLKRIKCIRQVNTIANFSSKNIWSTLINGSGKERCRVNAQLH